MIANIANRRARAREPVVANRVCVEWWTNNGIRCAEGRLLNISEGGALIAADDPPPVGQAVWFHLETPARTDEVSARVVRRGAANEIGLVFTKPCPYDVYLAAVLGVNPCGMLASY